MARTAPPSELPGAVPRRALSGLGAAALVVALVAAGPARAQPFEEIGAGLGMPGASSSQGAIFSVGTSFVDLDLDGDLDMVTSNDATGLAVYRRVSVGVGFRPWPNAPTLPGAEAAGHVVFDADGDGDPDLLVLGRRPHFYLNDGHGTLTDATAARLPELASGAAIAATAVDLEPDGDLDLFVACDIERTAVPWHRCAPDRLLENDGHGYFRDIAAEAGLGDASCGLQNAAFDVDHDGDLDLVAVDDFGPYVPGNRVWLNDGVGPDHRVSFHDGSAALGWVARNNGMGLAVADLDGDGGWEAVITNIGEPTVLSQRADGAFARAPGALGLDFRLSTRLRTVTWSTTFEDIDGDGWLDLLVAASPLPTPFLSEANATTQWSLLYRGDAAGALHEVAPALAFGAPDAAGAGRDLALVDLDRDGRPEVVLSDVTGRVAVWKNRASTRLPFGLELRPSASGAGAIGAHVEAACGGFVARRDLVGGARSGVADRGAAWLTFPACDALSITARVAWPSGYVSAATLAHGETTLVTEPAWLTFDPPTGRLVADFGASLAPPATASLELADVVATAGPTFSAGRLEATLALAPDRAEGHARLVLDGRPGPIVRLTAGPRVWLARARPTAGRALAVSVRAAAGATSVTAGFEGLTPTTLARSGEVFTGTVATPDATGPAVLIVSAGGATTRVPVDVAGPVDPIRTEVVAVDAYVLAPDDAPLRVAVHLRDASGFDVHGLELARLGVVIDGVPGAPSAVVETTNGYRIEVARARLGRSASVAVTLDGVALGGSFATAALDRADELAARVSPERSRCALSEPRLTGDGEDVGVLAVIARDAAGTDLPTWLAPHFTPAGASVVYGDAVTANGSWFALVRARVVGPGEAGASPAGDAVDTFEARLGTDESAPAIHCEVPLVAAGPPPVVADGELTLTGWHTDDAGREVARLEWVPLGAGGRAVGSGAAGALTVDGGEALTALAYGGLGIYEADLVADPGVEVMTATVTSGDVARTLELRVPTPAPETEPVAEVSPEPSPEEAPEAVVEPSAEPEPEPGPEPAAEPAEGDASADAGATSADAADASVEPAVESAPKPRADDDGCAGAGAAPAWCALAALVSSLRRGGGARDRAGRPRP